MIVILLRRSCKPIFAMSSPSMVMLPSSASTKRKKLRAIVDLPLPVAPTMPLQKSISVTDG